MKGMLIVPSWVLFCLLFLIKILELIQILFLKVLFNAWRTVCTDSQDAFVSVFLTCLTISRKMFTLASTWIDFVALKSDNGENNLGSI